MRNFLSWSVRTARKPGPLPWLVMMRKDHACSETGAGQTGPRGFSLGRRPWQREAFPAAVGGKNTKPYMTQACVSLLVSTEPCLHQLGVRGSASVSCPDSVCLRRAPAYSQLVPSWVSASVAVSNPPVRYVSPSAQWVDQLWLLAHPLGVSPVGGVCEQI